MARYTIALEFSSGLVRRARIVGLRNAWIEEAFNEPSPDTDIHLAELRSKAENFSPEILHGRWWYGGQGEGHEFATLEEALNASLYDEYQTNADLREGDEFALEFEGRTLLFRCVDVHVAFVRDGEPVVLV